MILICGLHCFFQRVYISRKRRKSNAESNRNHGLTHRSVRRQEPEPEYSNLYVSTGTHLDFIDRNFNTNVQESHIYM